MQPQMGGIIQVNIPDRNVLQASYMSFVSGGGLFIPSKLNVKLGEERFVLATLPDQSQKIPLTGKVVWINSRTNGTKPQGFAIQLTGEKGIYFKAEVEKLLAGSMSSTRPRYTI